MRSQSWMGWACKWLGLGIWIRGVTKYGHVTKHGHLGNLIRSRQVRPVWNLAVDTALATQLQLR